MNPFDTPEGRKALEKAAAHTEHADVDDMSDALAIVAMIEWLDDKYADWLMGKGKAGRWFTGWRKRPDPSEVAHDCDCHELAPTLAEALIAAVNATEEEHDEQG